MLELGKISLVVVGVIMLLGGVMGFVKGKSKASLIAGVISGLIYLALFLTAPGFPEPSFIAGAALSLVLAIMFITRLRKTKKFMPSGMLLAISLAEFATLLLCFLMR